MSRYIRSARTQTFYPRGDNSNFSIRRLDVIETPNYFQSNFIEFRGTLCRKNPPERCPDSYTSCWKIKELEEEYPFTHITFCRPGYREYFCYGNESISDSPFAEEIRNFLNVETQFRFVREIKLGKKFGILVDFCNPNVKRIVKHMHHYWGQKENIFGCDKLSVDEYKSKYSGNNICFHITFDTFEERKKVYDKFKGKNLTASKLIIKREKLSFEETAENDCFELRLN